jgi:hypothetical protein
MTDHACQTGGCIYYGDCVSCTVRLIREQPPGRKLGMARHLVAQCKPEVGDAVRRELSGEMSL